jgi:hypothetical protein
MVKVTGHTEYKVPNGNTIKYKIVGGTAYHEETPDAVIEIIEKAMQSQRKICLRFCFGDTDTGKDWCEKNDTIGYIGRSSGNIKVPLLLESVRSSGGGALLDHCIVKIEEIKRHTHCPSYHEVYRHPKYHLPTA